MSRPGFLDHYLPYLLRQADQTLSAPFYAELNEHGVARSEWRVIAVLHELGELSLVELATAALSPQPTITHAVRRLEARGLVTRTTGRQDKRQRFVALTPEGASLTDALVERAVAIETDLLTDAGDLDALREQLAALTATLEQRAAEEPSKHEAT